VLGWPFPRSRKPSWCSADLFLDQENPLASGGPFLDQENSLVLGWHWLGL